MSVINKVLRDLDKQAAGERPPATGRPAANPGAQMPPGVVAVPPVPAAVRQGRTRRGWLVPVLLAGVLASGAVLWWWQRLGAADPDHLQPAATSAMASPPATAPVAARPVDVTAVPTPESAVAPATVASEALFPPGVVRPEVLAPLVVLPPVPPPLAPALAAAAPPAPAAAPVAAPAVLASALPAPGVRQAQPVPTPPASAALQVAGTNPVPAQKPAPAEAPPVVLPPPVPWPEAALDAVGQAQRMWSSGAQDTALAFLRDALAGVERSHGSDLAPDRVGAAAGLAMVRELVRMEQFLANHAQVLALLKRHEVLWARQADLWAVRGSAAQRLSQHAEAADSYRMALRLRPGEPRWMLGAAVSLAVMGQRTDAAQLTEQARRLGPVNPEVLSFLRQLGVPLAGDNPVN